MLKGGGTRHEYWLPDWNVDSVKSDEKQFKLLLAMYNRNMKKIYKSFQNVLGRVEKDWKKCEKVCEKCG